MRRGPIRVINALQLRLEKRFSNGLQLLATYVWSKTIDESSDSGNGSPDIGTIDPNNFKLDRAVSQYNIPQVFQFTYVYQLPFGRGKHFGATMNLGARRHCRRVADHRHLAV